MKNIEVDAMENIIVDAEMRQLLKEAAKSLEHLELYSKEKEANDIQNRKTTGRATLATSIMIAAACETPVFPNAKKLLCALDAMYDEHASS